MLSYFFEEKKNSVEKGDFAVLKSQYEDKFPSVPADFIMRIEHVEQEQARVVFADFKGTKICDQTLPIYTLYRLG